jgi:hypothetical protein
MDHRSKDQRTALHTPPPFHPLRGMLLAALTTAAIAPVVQGQNTCYTNPQGVTLCSTETGVIHGSTSESGNTVFRDDRGRRLDFQTDSRGNATVAPAGGDPVRWSQPVLGRLKYPKLDTSPPRPPVPATPLRPSNPGGLTPPSGPIRQPISPFGG